MPNNISCSECMGLGVFISGLIYIWLDIIWSVWRKEN